MAFRGTAPPLAGGCPAPPRLRARLEGACGVETGGAGPGPGPLPPRQRVSLRQRVPPLRAALAVLAMLPARLRPRRLLSSAPLRLPAPRGAAAGGEPARSPGTARGKRLCPPRRELGAGGWQRRAGGASGCAGRFGGGRAARDRGRLGLGLPGGRVRTVAGTAARMLPVAPLLAWVPPPAGCGEVETDP